MLVSALTFSYSKCDLGQGPLLPPKSHKDVLLVYSLPLWLPKSWLNWSIMFLIRQLSAVVASSFPKAFAWLLKCFITINKNTIWEGCADMWIVVMTSSTSLNSGSVSLEDMRMLSSQQVHRTYTNCASPQQVCLSLGNSKNSEINVSWVSCVKDIDGYLNLEGWAEAEKEWIRYDKFWGHFRMLYMFINSFDYISRITMSNSHLTNQLYWLSLLAYVYQRDGSDSGGRTSPAWEFCSSSTVQRDGVAIGAQALEFSFSGGSTWPWGKLCKTRWYGEIKKRAPLNVQYV